ncbi:PQQ-binding-like beta-propeller repeat protein [Streptomyces sp. NPDC091215]|uniref:protein kinase domain-containing protein n=1 Tax=Streptomyces sp. NPDC091215 TaxID=3155192 RepID=UPI0034417A5A
MPLSTGGSGAAGSIGGYTLVDRLGSGGMGVVYLAHSPSGRQVAVKVVHAQYALDDEFRTRFRQEVAAARRVSGAFTAPVVDADPDAEQPWMATLYVPGRTLAEVVAEDGPLSGRELRTLGLGLVEALRDIHQAGVVHRDLKPSNVLLAKDGPRVIDFGISRAADNELLTVTGRLIGTPPFMSPEQFTAPRDVTAASDVFSLGSLLVYAATGNRPFDGGSPYLTGYQVMHEAPTLEGVPYPLSDIAERCLTKDPEFRPRLAELQQLLATLPDSAAAPPPTAPGPSRETGTTAVPVRRRRRRLAALGAALAVAAVSLTVYTVVSDSGTPAKAPAARRSSAPPSPTLPAGYRPWRASLLKTVRGGGGNFVDSTQSGCTADGSSVYCAGTGFTTARIDAATGRVVWRYGTDLQTTLAAGARDGIVYTYDKKYSESTFHPQRLVALDPGTRKQLWSTDVNTGQDRPALLFKGGVLVVPDDRSHLAAFDARTGRALWRTPAKSTSGPACDPAVVDGVPYGLCSAEDDPTHGSMSVLRLDPADGTARELAALPALSHPLGSVDGELLFAVQKPPADTYESTDLQNLSYTGLIRVDPATGAVVKVPFKAVRHGTVTLVGGVVCIVGPDGTVTALRPGDAGQVWQRETQIENLSTPVYSSTYDELYFVNRYGRLLALDRRTGAERWSTAKVAAPGASAESTVPSLLLVRDAIVAQVGDIAFSVRPDHPSRTASAG